MKKTVQRPEFEIVELQPNRVILALGDGRMFPAECELDVELHQLAAITYDRLDEHRVPVNARVLSAR